jgi:hypothetical protein
MFTLNRDILKLHARLFKYGFANLLSDLKVGIYAALFAVDAFIDNLCGREVHLKFVRGKFESARAIKKVFALSYTFGLVDLFSGFAIKAHEPRVVEKRKARDAVIFGHR